MSKGFMLTLLATIALATVAVASVRSQQKTGPIQPMITSEVVINTVDAAAPFNQMQSLVNSIATGNADQPTNRGQADTGLMAATCNDDVFVPGVTNSRDKAAAAISAQTNIASNDTATMKPTTTANHRMRATRLAADHTAGLQTNRSQSDESDAATNTA